MDDNKSTKKTWTSPALETLEMHRTAAKGGEGTENSFTNPDGSETTSTS